MRVPILNTRMSNRFLSAAALAIGLLACSCAWAQNELVVAQYMHNYFAVNPSFAGSRECLSIFGSFRKQWAGVESTPASMLLTANTPLRREKLTLGLSLYNQTIRESRNTGAMLSVGYRTRVGKSAWLGLALQPGAAFRSADWTKMRTMQADDPVFAEKHTGVAPLLGLGVSVYGDNFFAGVSSSSLLVTDDFDKVDTEFAPADATYLLCGGYWFNLGHSLALQPSVLADYSKATDAAANFSLSAIWRDMVWLTAAYRTNKDATFGLAYQPNERIKVAYNYAMSLGDVKSYNRGSHEISLQYDFVYRVKTVSHRFY